MGARVLAAVGKMVAGLRGWLLDVAGRDFAGHSTVSWPELANGRVDWPESGATPEGSHWEVP
jgi:hypothetical protein